MYTCRLEYPSGTQQSLESTYDLKFDGKRIFRPRTIREPSIIQIEKVQKKSSIPAVTKRDSKRKPTFSTQLMDRTATEGSTVKLTATVFGPDCECVWSRNNRELENTSKHRMVYNSESGMAILEIFNVTPEDAGEYCCLVGNCYGQNETSAKLKVYEGYEQSPMPPTFTRAIRGNQNRLLLNRGLQ